MSSFDDKTLDDIANSMIQLVKGNLFKNIYKLFTRHPNKNGITYKSHWWRAMKLSIKMAFGSLCLLIHSIFPFLCETTGTDIVKELYHYVTNYKLKENKEEEKKEEKKEEELVEENVESDEEDETKVIKFEIEGKTYLKSEDNILYDMESHDAIGIWNDERNEIENIPDEDED